MFYFSDLMLLLCRQIKNVPCLSKWDYFGKSTIRQFSDREIQVFIEE